jgi:carboxymethylenebutenolidase
MPHISLTASDGHTLGAYRADPEGAPRGGIVVIQEIFGVNSHIRSICDRLAADGYAAIAPALFDRTERDFESGYSPEEIEKARSFIAEPDFDAFLRDTDAACAALADTGKVGIVGFCLGGSVAFAAATRLDGFSAAVGFYGGRVRGNGGRETEMPDATALRRGGHGIPMSNVETVKEQTAGRGNIRL